MTVNDRIPVPNMRLRSVLFVMLFAVMLVTAPALAQELPRVWLDTTYAPPGGTLRSVSSGGDFQAALDAAQPGDIIQLQANATFTGNFILRAKTGTEWIYIRTSAHASLPSPGTRIDPTQHASLLPKLVSANTVPVIRTERGAHHYRFVGIEITTTAATNSNLVHLEWYNGSQTQLSDAPTDIVFDRTYVHGTPSIGVRRGILMNSARTAVIDSYFSAFHQIGNDSQALNGYNGPGPFKIVNNYLEGAGENLMFGGSDPSIPNMVPSDPRIRRPHDPRAAVPLDH